MIKRIIDFLTLRWLGAGLVAGGDAASKRMR